MRRLTATVASLCLPAVQMICPAVAQPAGPALGAPPLAGSASPSFAFSICNLSSSAKILVAVVSHAEPGTFRAQGWWTVPRGNADQCTTIGEFRRPEIWVYATNGQGGKWGRASINICTDLNRPFDYIWDGEPRVCRTAEELGGFVQLKVDPRAPRLEWPLRD